jgi:hypothetical protein
MLSRPGEGAEAQEVSMGALAGISGGMAVAASVGMVLLKLVSWRLKKRESHEAVWEAADEGNQKKRPSKWSFDLICSCFQMSSETS